MAPDMTTAYLFVGVAMLIAGIVAYPEFTDLIPNGNYVPDMCNSGQLAPGVGHVSPQGGGALNNFGEDFGAAHKNWTAVCNLDSDGDGLTNGEELNDKDCTWTSGDPLPAHDSITHPGQNNANPCGS